MEMHYLDNSATTPLCVEAKDAIAEMMVNNFGNPSSLHDIGFKAECSVNEARERILSALGIREKNGQLIFTSGGTEAANLALIGCATSKTRNKGKTVIIGESEHDCVLNSADHLSSLGYKIIKVPSPNGVWDMDYYKKALSPDVILVSSMLVNNETGAVNDIKAIASAAKDSNPDVVVHTDAVQGFLKLNKNYSDLGADLISVSGHKIGAPKGVGALYANERIIRSKLLSPIVFGGGQERGLRSGTENTLGIIGFGAAAKAGNEKLVSNIEKYSLLRNELISMLSEIECIRLNIPKTKEIAPNILNITVFGIRSETLMHFLSSKGVYVSSGSACSSNTGHPSNALKSFGINSKESGESIRISLGAENDSKDINAFVLALKEGVAKLARDKR